jgi:hypothetical protein
MSTCLVNVWPRSKITPIQPCCIFLFCFYRFLFYFFVSRIHDLVPLSVDLNFCVVFAGHFTEAILFIDIVISQGSWCQAPKPHIEPVESMAADSTDRVEIGGGIEPRAWPSSRAPSCSMQDRDVEGGD